MRVKDGYSLFEVLIAFAIMSLVLSVLLPGQTRLLQRVQTADEEVLATDYAVSLAELAAVTPLTQWRDARHDHKGWLVEQTVRQTQAGQPEMVIRVMSKQGRELAVIRAAGVAP